MTARPYSKRNSPAKRPIAAKTDAPNRTRFFFIGGAALFLIVIIAALLSSSSGSNYVPIVNGSPRAEVSRTLIDHGDVQMDDYVESVFRVQNTGSEPLQILGEPRVELVQGCCPPRAIVSKMTLQPGEESIIRLRFTMHDMMGGPHEFRVHVQTNDPTQPTIPLTILSNWVE